eukprot:Clim_evm74s77 gene=Clim_evmTU74s77
MNLDQLIDIVRTTFVLITTSIGAGILTVPYAFGVLGYWTIILLFVVTGLMLMGGLTLNYALANSKSFTFLDLCEEHLGRVGRYWGQLCMLFNLYFVAVIYLVLAASSLQDIFSHIANFSYVIWALITAAIMWPIIQMKDIKDMWLVLILAGVSSYTLAAVILAEAGDSIVEIKTSTFTNFEDGIQAASVCIFAYSFATLVPTARRNMKYPEFMHYPIIFVCLSLFLLYGSIGILNHAAYGCEVPSNILDRWNRNVPWYITSVCLAAHMIVACPLMLSPCLALIESIVLRIEIGFTQSDTQATAIDTSKTYKTQEVSSSTANTPAPRFGDGDVEAVDTISNGSNGDKNKDDNTTKPRLSNEADIDKLPIDAAHHERMYGRTGPETEGNWFYRNRHGMGRVLLRTLILGTLCFWAIIIPFFGDLEEATVGLALVSQTFVLPVLVYWAMNRSEMKTWLKVGITCMVVLFGIFAILASIFAIKDIINDASSFKIFQVPADNTDYLCTVA